MGGTHAVGGEEKNKGLQMSALEFSHNARDTHPHILI